MSPDREMTIGELASKVDDLASAIRELRSSLERNYLRTDLYEARHDHLVKLVEANDARHNAEIRELESRQTLIARTAVTALLLPVLTAVVIALVLGAFR